jgi:two-component system, NtrC family, sensor kinase
MSRPSPMLGRQFNCRPNMGWYNDLGEKCMRGYRNLSINVKLILLVLASSGTALLLALAVLVFNYINLIRESKIQQLSTLANVLGANSTAALSFDDTAAARELLSSLSLQGTIHYACLYNMKGQPFAEYKTGDLPDFVPPPPGPDGYKFVSNNYLDITQTVVREREKIGTIYLHASMQDLQNQLVNYAIIVAIVVVISLGVAVGLSSRLQRAISIPILQLAKTAQLVSANRDYSVRVRKYADDELGTLYNEFNDMLGQIERGENDLHQAHAQLKVRIRQLSDANVDLTREIAERKRAEGELDVAHKQLVDTARRAGMAEVATGVLHNVGNVLNSINVSATLVSDQLLNSKSQDLARAIDLMNQHAGNLDSFLREDEKGKHLCEFLSLVASRLESERKAMFNEMQSLAKNVNHVKTIVSMQQSYAGASALVETVNLPELIEDALALNASVIGKYGIELTRDFADVPPLQAEKQKVLQILVNLIRNAGDALVESGRKDCKLTLQIGPDVEQDEEYVHIAVIDNGLGIEEKNLTKIFSHGFTTKKYGHGFGLHSSANAAKEMGGSLSAFSNGPGRGAVFTLKLPFVPVEALT